ncbi:hypothetical protein K493DRAFT_318533 [Basidiobolus meristosporus CBS 931.73]|uniref:BZIP domain-containing protein n=1 Tax=Basidiobolus meristosporus CBS 931.73 TaxID=1314790 RepID=A0A1Y1XW10_9FUNG|nr:hypothetical protein K493DRAFT_318533 [Basidiobolus meristosporus CBS 931.73]|eukprot:ORX89666.1 hypothetical protein K493DRAFT_318533 [Basidiobolus meristosporus CBS 931.73]
MSETASRLGLPRSDFPEADVGAPTPTRFLLECGEYKLTPSLSALGEINPFEASFTSLGGKKEAILPTSNSNSRDLAIENTNPPPASSVDTPANGPELAPTSQTVTAQPVYPPIQKYITTTKSSEPASETSKLTAKEVEDGPRDQENSSDDSQSNKHDRSSGYKRKESDNPDNDEEKRRRFLERNRVAASKCRQKKKMWVKELEQKSEEITTRNKELQLMVSQLKEELLQLKSQLLGHRNCNCNVIQQYVQTSGHFSQLPLDVSGPGLRVAGGPMVVPVPPGNVLPTQPAFSNLPPTGTVVGIPPFVNN